MSNIEQNRTIVGIPFYDGEGHEVLEACLSNVDDGLNHLGIEAEIVIGINGPRVSMGNDPISYRINKSQYNAPIKFIKTPPGQVPALNELIKYARQKDCGKMFMTDADISRLPHALSHMWHERGDYSLVGVNIQPILLNSS